jgi:hypothetical protein
LSYVLAVARDFTPERRQKLQAAAGFFTRRAVLAVAAVAAALLTAALVIHDVAGRLAQKNAPVPALIRKAAPGGSRGPIVQPRPAESTRPPREQKKYWFEELSEPLPALLSSSKFDLNGVLAMMQIGPTSLPPMELASDQSPRIAFLSASDGRTTARVVAGSGLGVLAAVQDARARATPVPKARWFKLDLVAGVTPLDAVSLARPIRLEAGLQGLALQRESGVALLPEELLAQDLIDGSQRLRSDKIAAYLQKRPRAGAVNLKPGAEQKIYLFSTQSFFVDATTWQVLRLYRGHPLYQELSRRQLLEAARLGGSYLVAALDSSGRFHYQYRADTGVVLDKYNILRHAGTIYALLELYEVTRQPELLKAAERAIGYLLRQVQPMTLGGRQVSCVVEKGYAKLGGNALAVVALAKHAALSGSQAHLETIRSLTEWILANQQADGRFAGHKQAYPSGRDTGFVSGYYPGEALLALLRADAVAPHQPWVDAAARGALWLIQQRDGQLSDAQLSHDHWLLYALNELYRLRPDEIFLRHAMRLANVIQASQLREAPFSDWIGGYYTPPRTAPTATRSEALAAAYSLARDFQQQDGLQPILEALRLGNQFQLRTQLVAPTVMHLPDPARALGGFRDSLTDFDVRIDYVQHNLSSLLALYKILTPPA